MNKVLKGQTTTSARRRRACRAGEKKRDDSAQKQKVASTRCCRAKSEMEKLGRFPHICQGLWTFRIGVRVELVASAEKYGNIILLLLMKGMERNGNGA